MFNWKYYLHIWYPPVLFFILTFTVAGYFSTIHIDSLHDGIMLKPALDLVDGKMLFRDTFTLYGALSVLLQASALLLFGKYLLVIKILTAFFYGLCSIVLWFIWKKIMPGYAAVTALIVWLFLAPYYIWTFHAWSSVYGLFTQLVATYLFLRYFDNYDKRYIFLTGFFIALTFWFRQPVGVFLAVGICCFLYIFRYKTKQTSEFSKELKIFLMGGVSVSSPFFLWFIAKGALYSWYLQSLKFSSVWVRTISNNYDLGKIFASLFPTGPDPLSPLWAILPVITIFLWIASWKAMTWKKNKDKDVIIILALSTLALASWLQYYPATCIRHVYWGGTPMIGLAAYFCWHYLPQYIHLRNYVKPDQAKIIIFFVALISLTIYDIGKRLNQGVIKATNQYVTLSAPPVLKGMRVLPDQAKMFTDLYHDIRVFKAQHPQANIVTIGTQALFQVVDGNNRNIQPMFIDWGVWNTSIYPDYRQKLATYVLTEKPMVLADNIIEIPGYCSKKEYKSFEKIVLLLPCE